MAATANACRRCHGTRGKKGVSETFSKFQAGIVFAVAMALTPLIVNEGWAGNGATSYFTLRPGASKTLMTGVENRICHDSGPPVDVIIGTSTKMTRMLGAKMCVFSIGRNITLRNETSSPITLHTSIVQKTGH
jgi:hypothetical protein